MLGALIVFFVVLLIVAVYMTIVHLFLASAEEPEDIARERAFASQTEMRQQPRTNNSLARQNRPIPSMEF